MAKRIVCIVEGQGDVEAIPIVVRRIAERIDPEIVVQVPTPMRIPKSRLVKPTELERAVEFAARQIAGAGAVLVVVDSDDDCPAVNGPTLLGRAGGVRIGLPVAVVLANREFESWFIAAAGSLAGCAGLASDIQAPANPESIRGAKEWLTARMISTRAYSPTLDQPAMAAAFDLASALGANSFEKLHREIERLLLEAPDAW